jgi:acyl-coenzyme A synthetase/AMP-(fatty) acid ligase
MNYKIGYNPKSSPNNNIITFLKNHSQQIPNKIIFYTPNEQISYKEFYLSVQKLANGFISNGINQEDYVLLIAPLSSQLYLILFALNYIGAIPVFIESLSQINNMSSYIAKLNPKAIIAPRTVFELIDRIITKQKICLHISINEKTNTCDYTINDLLNNKPLAKLLSVTKQHTALLTFTTGSSGEPKGVVRSHQFLAAQHYALSRIIPYTKKAIDLPTFPIFTLNNIASGISTVLPEFKTDTHEPVEMQKLIEQLNKYNINYMTISPMIFNALSYHCTKSKILLPKINRIITGGAPLSRDNLIQFQKISQTATEIFILYGSTEVEPITCTSAKKTLALNEKIINGANVGKIDKLLKYKIIKPINAAIKISISSDWDSIISPANTPGELIVAGEHVCKTYFENNDAFYKTKIIDIDNTVWHRTGDIVTLDTNNNIIMLGRKHTIIGSKNGIIYPIIAETLIKKHPNIIDAAIVNIAPSYKKPIIIFAITPKKNISKGILKKEIKKKCKKNNIYIDKIKFVTQIPRDHRMHSKIDYTALAKILRKQYAI